MFWHSDSRIFGGVVWSDCDPWMDRQNINSKEALPYGFRWWPCIYSLAPGGLVYMKCQDFAFTGGRPRPCDFSRLVPFVQLAGPVPPSSLPEEVSDDDAPPEPELGSQSTWRQMWRRNPNRSNTSGLSIDGGSYTAGTQSGWHSDTDESIHASTSSSLACSTAATPGSVLSCGPSSSSSGFSWCMPSASSASSWVPPTSSSASEWACPTGLSDYEVGEF